MAFSPFLRAIFRRGSAADGEPAVTDCDMAGESYAREMALSVCVTYIANALSKCELKVFLHGRETRADEWRRWNISPNVNQTSSMFWAKFVNALCRNGEALAVFLGGGVYVADSFCHERRGLDADVFHSVFVDDVDIRQRLLASEVVYVTLPTASAVTAVQGLCNAYSTLLSASISGYKRSRGEKGVLELDTNAHGDKHFTDTLESMRSGGFRRFATSDSAVLTLWRGMKYTPLGSKTYSSDTTRDIRSLVDDMTDFYARALGIPPSLLNGSVQDVSAATKQFLTFCLDPLCDHIAEAIAKNQRDRHVFYRFDTSAVEHFELISNAGSLSQLVAAGALSINDILDMAGRERLPYPWADEHYITKNYDTAERRTNDAPP